MQKNDVESMKALVALGADINALNNSHHTPLDTAEYVRANNVARLLMEVGGLKGESIVAMETPRPKRHRSSEEDEEEQMRELAVGGEWCVYGGREDEWMIIMRGACIATRELMFVDQL